MYTRFADYQRISRIFVRLLGVIYLIAFVSLSGQILGLIGSQGILPLVSTLDGFASQYGWERYFVRPSLFWLSAEDWMIQMVMIAGCIFSGLIIADRWRTLSLISAFLLYLSVSTVSVPFLNFQWDSLLLEAGFLAIFLATGSGIVIFLFRWLLFKLRFLSGLSKLTSGDPAWSGMTALSTYFEVQPLPNPVAWHFHQFPAWILQSGTALTLIVELLVPFMMFMPRRWRFFAAWVTILFQLLIIATSNHNWINLLTILLCLFLFDDRAIGRFLPSSSSTGSNALLTAPEVTARSRTTGRFIAWSMALLVIPVNALLLWDGILKRELPEEVASGLHTIQASAVINLYHVFPTMTTERYELVLSGSHDGRRWQRYDFHYRPTDPARAPAFIVPHQPRLDWHMWFVTLHPVHYPWFESFVIALLENRPGATSLLKVNPFEQRAPNIIRIDAVRYRFTTAAERTETGLWWHVEPAGPFNPLPQVSRPH